MPRKPDLKRGDIVRFKVPTCGFAEGVTAEVVRVYELETDWHKNKSEWFVCVLVEGKRYEEISPRRVERLDVIERLGNIET
jgi:hypothetical protein